MGTVSVIIPAYNCAAYLIRALESVAAQNVPKERLEVLVIDDGSTDDTADRIAAFQARGEVALRYVRQSNAGVAAARNHGLRLARGEVIAFLDADDWWFPSKLARQLPLLAGDVGLVYCDNVYVDEQGAPIAREPDRANRYRRGNIELALFCDNFVFTPAPCIRRDCVDRAGFFDERMAVGEDYAYFLRLASCCEADFVVDRLWAYTVRAASLSNCDKRGRDGEFYRRLDLSILHRHLSERPDFARRNRIAVRKRLAHVHWEIADTLLDKCHGGAAARQLLASLASWPTFKALKSGARIVVPRHAPHATK